MRRSSVANGLGSFSKVATDMPQQPSSRAVSGPPASTPVSGLPTSSSRQSSRMEAKPRRASTILMPSALLWGMVSENHIWNSAKRCARSARGLVGLAIALKTHLARREILHDLDRAAADRHHLGLAIDALDLGAAQVARAAEHLHRLVGAEFQGRSREVLQHADLGDRLLALADPPGQELQRRADGVDAHRHVDQAMAYDLVGDQRFSEGMALAGIGDRLVEADLGIAAGAGRHAEPLLVEVQHDADEAFVLLADQVVDRHPHIVEEQLSSVGRPPAHLLELGAPET